MLDAVQRYARKVLLVHLLLLALVVFVVLGAARAVYRSARAQSIQQNEERMDLLAQQTSRGIENYYMSIMQDLEACLVDESDPSSTQPWVPPVRGRPERISLRQYMETHPLGVDQRLAGVMWKQLRTRVSHLFVIDNETGKIIAYYPDGGEAFARRITADNLEWFRSLKDTSMSHLVKSADDDSLGDYHVIAVPAMGIEAETISLGNAGRGGAVAGGEGRGDFRAQPGGFPGGGFNSNGPGGAGVGGAPQVRITQTKKVARTVVAIVPVNLVKERFFDSLNQQGVVNAALLDDSGTVLVSINPKMVGMNVLSKLSAGTREKMRPLITGEKSGTGVIDVPYEFGGETMPGRIMAFEPINQLPGRRWTVLISSPVSQAEALVKDLFKDAMLWAIFVSLSITGILASTSFFMIRSRVRYERARHDVLARELNQARQIQLAWLPNMEQVPKGLEVSAANLPASHISGDFYNWFHLPVPSYSRQTAEGHEPELSSKVAIVIGDVTGHGMAAAFLMATTQLLVRTTLSRYQDPGRCLQEVNRQLCTQGFQGQFVTMLVIVLDPETHSIEIATAGHPAPLVERGGKFESLTMEPHLVLGVDATEHYTTQGFILEPGASVMLYTDGVVEAVSETGEQYGVERLMRSLSGGEGEAKLDPQSRITAVLNDVKRFCHGRELLDDVTMVAVRTTAAVVEMSAGTTIY
jgi:sigma-B regulation protein RsbU (phosphoserine phosphatase)